jgi:ribosomal protein S18 acetylase RimI-like enzyme
MTLLQTHNTSSFMLSHFRPENAEEVAAFLNGLRQRYWSLTASAYQRQPEHIPLHTAASLLEEQRRHPHRLGYYILRHKGQIIAAMKIDDKFGDGQVAIISDLEIHPNFQRRGIPWFHLQSCVRRVFEMDYDWVELVTWAFNRKGLPLYKRAGFRAVPGTSLLMENYLPLILRNPVMHPYFQRHDYGKTLVNKRSYGFDNFTHHGLEVFQYQWRAAEEAWEVLIDFGRRQIASIGCRAWSFGAWVICEDPMLVRIRLESREADEIICYSAGGSTISISIARRGVSDRRRRFKLICLGSGQHLFHSKNWPAPISVCSKTSPRSTVTVGRKNRGYVCITRLLLLAERYSSPGPL